MFDQLKKLQELKKLQDSFKKEQMTQEKNGVSVTMNGNFEIIDIKLNPDMDAVSQQGLLKETINKAREDIQKKLAQTMMSSGISF